jgi:hypothetical protein
MRRNRTIRRWLAGIAAFAIAGLAAPAALAQVSLFDLRTAAAPAPGWTVTPSLGYAGVFDDNALVRGEGEVLPGDVTNAINPRLSVDFNSRRSQLSAFYDGSLVAYRELSSLNSFDQRVSAHLRRLMTRRVAWIGQMSFSESPTTEALGVVGVPYLRVGSRLVDTRTGVEVTLSKRTTVGADYGFQWLDFDDDPSLGLTLMGGTNHSMTGSVRHALAERAAIIGTYNLQLATVVDGGRFAVQNAQGGVEFEPAANTRVFATAGFSYLSYSDLVVPRVGPAFRLGLSRGLRTTGAWDVSYSRAFVPSFGFAGTSENEELITRVLVPLGPRLYARGTAAWRRNEPLVPGGLRLKSTWLEAGLGYSAAPWMRIEGFYDGTRQEIDRPGGHLIRNRVGLQVVTAKPMRIR